LILSIKTENNSTTCKNQLLSTTCRPPEGAARSQETPEAPSLHGVNGAP